VREIYRSLGYATIAVETYIKSKDFLGGRKVAVTVMLHWRLAKAWLKREIGSGQDLSE
jgi:hypothetical protein